MTMCGAEDRPTPPIACNLGAIAAADRPRYRDLMARLRSAIRESHELQNGYALDLDVAGISLIEVAEWMNMERLCCPFLALELGASGTRGYWTLRVTGPIEAKDLIREEFLLNRQR